MAQGTSSTAAFPPPYSVADNAGAQQSWTFLFTTINPISSSRLQIVGIGYILLGILAMGLEAGIVSRASDRVEINLSFYEYTLFGIHLFALGVTLLVLCRHQVYVLIGVFALVFFQLITLIHKSVGYSVVLKGWSKGCSGSQSTSCDSTQKALIVVTIICAIISMCLTIVNMFVIKRAGTPEHNLPQFQPTPVTYSNSTPMYIAH